MDWMWNDKTNQYNTGSGSGQGTMGGQGMSFDNDGGYAMADDERVNLPNWVIGDQRNYLANQGEDQLSSIMGQGTPVQKYLSMQRNSGGDGGRTGINQTDDDYLTEDEHRAEMAKMAHPTSLMMSNPLMPAAQQMLGNMGYGSGQMPGMNQMQDMNQFMEIPFSSGLGGMFPNNQIPINPSMPEGSLEQPAENKPGGNIPAGYGHLAGAAPSWTQGQTGQQGLMNNPMQGQGQGQGMNGMWNGLMGMFGGK